jgi:antitoxin component YwqK of YwqJK toxin-antitoxin module
MIIFNNETLNIIAWVIASALLLIMGWLFDENREKDPVFNEVSKEERVFGKEYNNYVIDLNNDRDINKIYVKYEYLDSFIVQDYFAGVIYSVWGVYTSKNINLRYEQKYKEGKKYGSCREWYKNGQLKKEEQYKQGKLYGISKAWYENDQLKDSVSYLNGFRDGLRKEWYENGQLKHQSLNHLIMILDQKTQENVWKHWTSDVKNWDEFGYEIE